MSSVASCDCFVNSSVESFTISYQDNPGEIQELVSRIQAWKSVLNEKLYTYENNCRFCKNFDPVLKDSASSMEGLLTGVGICPRNSTTKVFEYKFENQIYGMAVVLYSGNGKFLELHDLARNPSFIGIEKSHKVGTAIISKILEEANSRAVENFSFLSYSSSLDFYKKLGFDFDGEGDFAVSANVNREQMQQIFYSIQQKLLLTRVPA
jgi:hypothetical protein